MRAVDALWTRRRRAAARAERRHRRCDRRAARHRGGPDSRRTHRRRVGADDRALRHRHRGPRGRSATEDRDRRRSPPGFAGGALRRLYGSGHRCRQRRASCGDSRAFRDCRCGQRQGEARRRRPGGRVRGARRGRAGGPADLRAHAGAGRRRRRPVAGRAAEGHDVHRGRRSRRGCARSGACAHRSAAGAARSGRHAGARVGAGWSRTRDCPCSHVRAPRPPTVSRDPGIAQ